MTKQNVASLEFRLKQIDKTKISILEQIKHNELITKKHERMRKTLSYFAYVSFLTYVLQFFLLLH